MAVLNKLYTFAGGTKAFAAEVNAVIDQLVDFVNNSVIHVDGSKAFTALPLLPATDPTNTNHPVRKSYADAIKSTADSAAATAASAESAAATAQATADAKYPNDGVKHGYFTGTTNAAGDVAVTHNLGRNPSSIQLTPVASGGNMPWKLSVENWDGSTINVRMYNSTNGNAIPAAGVSFFWLVTG